MKTAEERWGFGQINFFGEERRGEMSDKSAQMEEE